jgi:hypothetical protein
MSLPSSGLNNKPRKQAEPELQRLQNEIYAEQQTLQKSE